MAVAIDPSWGQWLAPEFEQPYFQQLVTFLKDEKAAGNTLYPPGSLIFEAFRATPFPNVKVVLLGQDPYHGAGQAHGLSFSVPTGVRPPPSLLNMYKELEDDLGVHLPRPLSGNLSGWAAQGVLLLNATLTVRAGQAGSHQNKGWETFTDAVIRLLDARREHLVFFLWGKYAQQKGTIISRQRHLVLTAAHPSPYAADKGFFGCRHFSQANDYLVRHGLPPIDWTRTAG